MSSRATPPSVFCPDLTFVPRGPHEGKRPVPLNRPVNVISTPVPSAGADDGAPPLMSRVVVLNIDGQLYIRDLYGRANLRWNGEGVAEARVRDGDKVQLGKIEYNVVATKWDLLAAVPPPPASVDFEIVTPGGAPPVRVRTPVTVFGTTAAADVRLPAKAGGGDACAMILRMGELYWLWNLEPASELRVNGQVVTRAELTDGSDVSVGGAGFRFRAVSVPVAAVAAAPAKAQSKQPSKATPAAPPAKTQPAKAQAKPAQPKPPVQKAPAAKPAPVPSGVVKTFSLPAPPDADVEPTAAAAPTPVAPPAAAKPAAKAPPPVVVGRTRPAPSGAKPRVPQAVTGNDADGIRQWGPLAFAVAAADRPELQGSQGPVAPPPGMAEERAEEGGGGGRMAGIVIAVVVVLALLAAGAFYGRKYLGF